MGKSLDTKVTVAEIQSALALRCPLFNIRQDIMIPNLSWGLLNHEADFVCINKSHYLTEVEIKRSLQDLRADFKKDVFHRDDRVYRFFFCLPLTIKDKALEVMLEEENIEKLRELYHTYSPRPAIIWYDEECNLCYQHQGAGWSYTGGRKLFLEEVVTVGRLLSMRYWPTVDQNNFLQKRNAELDEEIETLTSKLDIA